MTNFIIEGSLENAKEYIKIFLEKEKINPYDTFIYDSLVKIEQAKDIKKSLAFTSNNSRAFIFFGLMTNEAQNSLLKIIEESEGTFFIFYSQKKDDYLPTILSRCKEIKLENNTNDNKLEKTLSGKSSFGYGEIDNIIEVCGKDISTIIPVFRGFMLDEKTPNPMKLKYYLYLKRLLATSSLTTTNNVNERIVLEYVFSL